MEFKGKFLVISLAALCAASKNPLFLVVRCILISDNISSIIFALPEWSLLFEIHIAKFVVF